MPDLVNVKLHESAATVNVVPASGLPVQGTDAAGEDTYASVVTAPARTCHYLHVSVATHAATISLDGGTTDHFTIPAGSAWLLEGLSIPASADIQARNAAAGSNYADLAVSVW